MYPEAFWILGAIFVIFSVATWFNFAAKTLVYITGRETPIA